MSKTVVALKDAGSCVVINGKEIIFFKKGDIFTLHDLNSPKFSELSISDQSWLISLHWDMGTGDGILGFMVKEGEVHPVHDYEVKVISDQYVVAFGNCDLEYAAACTSKEEAIKAIEKYRGRFTNPEKEDHAKAYVKKYNVTTGEYIYQRVY